VQVFPRKEDGNFEGVLLICHKREGLIELEKLCDVGTSELSVTHQNKLSDVSGNLELEAPEDRCLAVRKENKPDVLETSNPDFCRIELDPGLVFRGAEFEEAGGERSSLVLDFLEIVERFHRVEDELFAGALQA